MPTTILDKAAFANSLAILTGFLCVAFYVLSFVAPRLFEFLFNAQFFGAKVASLLPKKVSVGKFAGILVTLVVTGWLFGYVWAGLYNLLAK